MSVYMCVPVSESHRDKSVVEQKKEDIVIDTINVIAVLALFIAFAVFICRSAASDKRKDTEEGTPNVKVVDHVLKEEDYITRTEGRNLIRDLEDVL